MQLLNLVGVWYYILDKWWVLQTQKNERQHNGKKVSLQLDPKKLPNIQKACDYDPKIWWLEELQGEILEFAQIC